MFAVVKAQQGLCCHANVNMTLNKYSVFASILFA